MQNPGYTQYYIDTESTKEGNTRFEIMKTAFVHFYRNKFWNSLEKFSEKGKIEMLACVITRNLTV